jgi:5-formyltetrahydrofolate cyclo-ligase
MDTREKKSDLRTLYRQSRKVFTDVQKSDADNIVFSSLTGQNIYKKSLTVGIYVSTPTEADTHRIIADALQRQKTVVVPKILQKPFLEFHKITSLADLKMGSFSILEPISGLEKVVLEAIELFIVPGVAFDKKGYRLGSGGGYTDWLFSHSKAYKIGVSYSFQVADSLPIEPYDMPIDMLITEKEIFIHKEA